MEEFITVDKARSELFHSFDARSILYSSLEKDPCPAYDAFAVNDLKEFEAPIITEQRISLHDAKPQALLKTPVPLFMFLDMDKCHIKFTPLYIVDKYLEGNIPGTLETFGTPYIPDNDVDISSYKYIYPTREMDDWSVDDTSLTSSSCSVSKDNSATSRNSTSSHSSMNTALQRPEISHVPFYLHPEFYLKHLTPSTFHPVRDVALRPHYIELMHFRDRHPYVESSFLFLQNILYRRANYCFAYAYYGSFQGVQQSFKYMMDIDELSELVRHSPYFTKNLRKLFYMTDEDVQAFYQQLENEEKGEEIKENSAAASTSDQLKMYPLYIKQFPVHIQLMQKLEGLNFYNYVLRISQPQVDYANYVPENQLLSLFAQIAVQLDIYQHLFDFRHNDLHGQNVMITKLADSKPVDFIEIDQYFCIPVFQNQIAQLIDFGRAKFTFQGEQYFSDEMSPWGAVNDHCNAKSSAYFHPRGSVRPVPKPFDMAYLCCMIAQYLSIIGGSKVYRTFLERYPRVFEFMYECTKRKNGGSSLLESGMKFIRTVIWPVSTPEEDDGGGGGEGERGSEEFTAAARTTLKRKKRNIANHKLIEPASISFDSNLVLLLIDSLDETIDPVQILQTNPRLSSVFQARMKRKNNLQYTKTELSQTLMKEMQNMRSTSEDTFREERLQKHRLCQGQVLHQIRKRFHGKLQNPFSCKDDERDYHDMLDTF